MGALRSALRRLLFLGAASLPAFPAPAATWEAPSAGGLVVRVEQDSFRTRDGYVLTRRYPDGTPDAQFGEQGSTVFALGPDNEGPAAVRLDGQSRIWVAGASLGAGDRLQAVVLRFGALGKPDRSYAQDGRSAVQPGGRAARALDVAPQPDGSAYVAGIVNDASGTERTGWWRLLPDGSLDRQFGLGGLWVDSGPEPTEVLAFTAGADGSVTLRLRRGQAADAAAEDWTLPQGARMPQRLAPPLPRTASSAPATVAPAPRPMAVTDAGSALEGASLPRTGAGASPATDACCAPWNVPWQGWLSALVLGLAWLWWRLRR